MLKMVCSSLPKEAEVLIVLLIGVAVSMMALLELLDTKYVDPERVEDRG